MPSHPRRHMILVGDSDIARWPAHLYPCLPGVAEVITDEHGNVSSVSGHSGATLSQVVPHVQEALQQALLKDDNHLILIVCAGENDIGQGQPLEASVKALENLLEASFSESNTIQGSIHVVFLGPKFEPWLNDDLDSKRAYSAMDRAFQRCCQQHANATNIHYVDCLVMFCGSTANLPGARLGGKAQAQEEFFDSDQLHLCDQGYEIWKDVVETIIQQRCL